MPNVDQPDNDTAPRPMSAAEHCATAGDHFARAQEIYIEADLLALDQRTQEYQQHMEWAWMHLRFAEVVTQGSRLLAEHRQALANPHVKLQTTDLGREAGAWNDFIADRPDFHGGRRTA